MARTRQANVVAAREAVLVVVGARPITYGTIEIVDRRTQELKRIDNQNVIVDAGDEGTPYAFRQFQRVRADHPAVIANPDAFIPVDEAGDDTQTVPSIPELKEA